MSGVELNLIVIRSADIDCSAAFYKVIGLPLVEEKHKEGPGHFAAELGKLVFEIYPLGKRTPTQDIRLGFFVQSVDETLMNLGEELVVKQSATNTDRAYLAVIEDPDGHTIELLQYELTGE